MTSHKYIYRLEFMDNWFPWHFRKWYKLRPFFCLQYLIKIVFNRIDALPHRNLLANIHQNLRFSWRNRVFRLSLVDSFSDINRIHLVDHVFHIQSRRHNDLLLMRNYIPYKLLSAKRWNWVNEEVGTDIRRNDAAIVFKEDYCFVW